MTLRIGTAFQIERNPRDIPGTLTEAYWMLESGTTYVLGTGNKAGEAAAFLKDVGSGVFELDSLLSEEDRKMSLIDATTVIL